MTIEIDARGLSCPQPVMLARQAMKAGQFPIVVLVDDETAVMNVRRQAEKSGLQVEVAAAGEEYRITLSRQ